MERIKIDPKKYAASVVSRSGKGINHDYQLLGEEIESFFRLKDPVDRLNEESEEEYENRENKRKKARRALWASFWRVEDWKHRQALKVCQTKGIASIRYFWGVIKNIK